MWLGPVLACGPWTQSNKLTERTRLTCYSVWTLLQSRFLRWHGKWSCVILQSLWPGELSHSNSVACQCSSVVSCMLVALVNHSFFFFFPLLLDKGICSWSLCTNPPHCHLHCWEWAFPLLQYLFCPAVLLSFSLYLCSEAVQSPLSSLGGIVVFHIIWCVSQRWVQSLPTLHCHPKLEFYSLSLIKI